MIKPMRQTFLPFALPDTGDNEIEEIAEAIRSGWITTGPKTHQFEAEFAAAVGTKHAIAVNSGTAAMHLALEATGLQAGDLVLTTPYTFAATAEVIRYFKATPVFVDIEPDTLNINPNLAAQTLNQFTIHNSQFTIHNLKAIIPVHMAGLPADLDAIYALAAQHNLAVIEDAAHAFPARYKGQMIGSQYSVVSRQSPDSHASHVTHHASLPTPPNSESTIPNSKLKTQNPSTPYSLPPTPRFASLLPTPHFTCFSFYATKPITTGEGGIICTGDNALAERCRVMALHGISKDAWKRYTAEGSWYYEIIAPGYKYNMTDIAAAMGLAQLRKAERMWQRRREIAGRYNEAFSTMPELQIPADRANCRHAWHLYLLRLHLDKLTINRAQFIEELKRLNIGSSVHFIPLHLHPYYRETYGYQPDDFPVAYRQYQRVISLPVYSKMSDQDVADVIRAVKAVVGEYRVKRVGSRE